MCCRYGSDHGACHVGPESRGNIATWEGTVGLVQKKKLGPRLFCRTYVVLAPAPLWHGAHPHEKPLKRPHAWHCPGAPRTSLDPLRGVGAVQVGAAVGAEVVACLYVDHRVSAHGALLFLACSHPPCAGIRFILLILTDTALAAIRLMRACARVAVCLLGWQMHAVATAPRSSRAKTCTKCKPLTFVHVDENDPQVE